MESDITLLEGLGITISALALIATIIGWTVTGRLQRKLLKRQIDAEIIKTKLQFGIPRKLEMLDKITNWRNITHELDNNVVRYFRDPVEKESLKGVVALWESRLGGVVSAAHILDPPSDDSYEYLGYWLTKEYVYHRSKMYSLLAEGGESEFNLEEMQQVSQTIEKITQRIAAITQDLLGSSSVEKW